MKRQWLWISKMPKHLNIRASPAQCHSKVRLSETYFASLLLWPLVVPKRQSVRLFRLRFRTLQGLKHYVSMNEWSG